MSLGPNYCKLWSVNERRFRQARSQTPWGVTCHQHQVPGQLVVTAAILLPWWGSGAVKLQGDGEDVGLELPKQVWKPQNNPKSLLLSYCFMWCIINSPGFSNNSILGLKTQVSVDSQVFQWARGSPMAVMWASLCFFTKTCKELTNVNRIEFPAFKQYIIQSNPNQQSKPSGSSFVVSKWFLVRYNKQNHSSCWNIYCKRLLIVVSHG